MSTSHHTVHYRTAAVEGIKVFYREDGDPKAPTILPPGGAEAFKRDMPEAEVHLYDTGHFALETHVREIAAAIRDFLGRQVSKQVEA